MNTEEKIQPEFEEEIDLMDYVRVLIKRKGLVLGLCLVAAIVAGVLSLWLPKIYRVDTSLEVGYVEGVGDVESKPIEAPGQIVEKINADVYGVLVREKLQISEKEYPEIRAENPKGTNLVKIETQSSKPELAKKVLEETNNLILVDHQEKIKIEKGFLEKNIEFLEDNINVLKKDIERVKIKIGFLEEEKKNLEAKVEALQKILPYQQDPGTQFALFDTKEKPKKN